MNYCYHLLLLLLIILLFNCISIYTIQVYDNGNYKLIIDFDRFNSSNKIYKCLQNNTITEKSYSIKFIIENSYFKDLINTQYDILGNKNNNNNNNNNNIINNLQLFDINLMIDLLDYLQINNYDYDNNNNDNTTTITTTIINNIIIKPSFLSCLILSNNSNLSI